MQDDRDQTNYGTILVLYAHSVLAEHYRIDTPMLHAIPPTLFSVSKKSKERSGSKLLISSEKEQ